jgi:hypothetical protein
MEENKNKTLSFILAIVPILDPYTIFGFPLLYIVVMYLLFFLILNKLSIKLFKPLLILLLVIMFTTLCSFLISDEYRQFGIAVKSLILWFSYFLAACVLWTHFNYKKFFEYAGKIAIFSSFFLLLQLLFFIFGLNPPTGMIPGLQLSEYNGWAPLVDVTGELRLHSIFQEPSYFAIYTLPICAYFLKSKRYLAATFLTICCIITTSTLAIIGLLLIFIWFLFTGNMPFQKMILSVFVIFIIHLILFNTIGIYNEVFTYSISKISGISNDLESERMGSTRIRLIGYVNYFFNYPNYFKVLGTGANQFSHYLSIYNIAPYSSTVVITLLNYGLIGLVVLLYIFTVFIIKTRLENIIYPLIFIMICFVDAFWFNWYFFYTITFIIINYNIRKNGGFYEKKDIS